MSRNYFNNKGGGGQGGPPNMGWPGLYGYQGYQGQGGQYGAAGARGGYNRQGPDRSSEYFVNDEVVGASSRERQAPPAAHAGSQHQGLHGMQPWAGVPPSAHAAYAGFPPGFGFGGYGAYGGWEGYSQVAQAYGQMMEKSGMMDKKEDRRDSGEQKESSKERQLFPSSSSSSASAQQKSPEAKPEPIVRNDREEREVAREHHEEQPDHRFETKSSPEVKSEDRDIKTPTDMKYDLLFPPRSAQESSRKQEPPSSPTTSTHSTEMISPTSRRKQASPQKKLSPPDAPGGATVLITHAGRQLSPDREDSPPMKSSPAKPEMDQSPAKSEYDQNSQRSPAKSTTSNMSEDVSRSNQHSPERARLEIHHLIEKEDFSSSSEVSNPAQESTPQRRKSKAEMKEYVVPKEGTSASPTKVFKKVEEDLEAMFSEKSSDIKSAEVAKAEEDNAKDESNIESSDQPDMEMETNKPDFQKVEDDLEAMFGGLEEDKEKEKPAEKSPDPEKKKRGRRPKAAKAPEPEDEEAKAEQVNPVNSGRATSKRKSAQNAEMRMKDDMDDILDQIINRKKPKKISSSSAQPSIDEAPSEGQEPANEAQAYSKVETKEAKPEKVTKTKSKEESTPGQPDFVPKYKKTELTSSKDETKNNDTDNIFDFQDSEDDSSVSRQKPRDKKVKKIDTFDGILSNKQPKERSSKIKLKQGRHGKIATEVSPEKPAELKFTKPYEKKATEDLSKEKSAKADLDIKANQTSVLSSEKSKAESTEEKVKSLAERRSRRSKGEVKVDAAEDSLAASSTSPLETSPPPASKDSPQPSLILDTRRSGGSRRASTDSILVKEDEIEARRSRQRKWEDLDKGVAKPAEKEVASLTPKGKSSKSAESIMLEGSEEIKRIFDESLKNKDPKAEDAKQVIATETQSKEAPVSPKVRGRLGRRGKAREPSSEPASEPVEEAKPESTQEVAVRSSRRSKGTDVAAEANVEPATELAESTSRASRRNKVVEAVTGRAVEATQEPAADVAQEAGGRPSRRSRGGQETTSAVESDSTVAAGKAAGKGSDGKGKIGAAAAAATAAAVEKEKVDEVTSAAAEPADDDSTLSKAEASKSLSKKLEIKINKLDLQEAMPKSNEGSKVDLGGLMSRYPGLLLAASKDTKEKEKEALGSPTEPEGRRSRRNRRSSDMSATNKDEIAGGSQDLEVSGRGRKRKVSSELSQLHLPAGIEVVKIEDSTPTPDKVPSDTPTRRRSRRGSDGVNEDPVVQMEVEDSILTDGLESVADTSNVDSANVSTSQMGQGVLQNDLHQCFPMFSSFR